MRQGLHKDKLSFGEVYETYESGTWSKWIEEKDAEGVIHKSHHGEQVTVPEGQRLIFRSFVPYAKNKEQELALFYWLEGKITICLVVSEQLVWFNLEHIPWELRHITQPRVRTTA